MKQRAHQSKSGYIFFDGRDNPGFSIFTNEGLDQAVINAPTAKVNAAFDKWVRPKLLNSWKTNIHRDRKPMPASPTITEQKIILFQETLDWLSEKPVLLDHESKWTKWAMARIHELKYPPTEFQL